MVNAPCKNLSVFLKYLLSSIIFYSRWWRDIVVTCVCPYIQPSIRPSIYPHDNSSQIWARIPKFTTNMHPGIFSAGIENVNHGHWPSRSLLYPSHNEVVGGYIGFIPAVCPSGRPASHVRSVAPTVLVGSISYLCILSSNFRRCVACKVSCKISKFEFLEIFFKFVALTLSCFDLGSDVNP